ncbi:Lrp/AsnC family transcriptional regulator [Peterkaempfera bronchialis]|uniref:Lrp/AsnC family transcriptional regulator n=1 Tax=Peterkaempfera bronchialis TaxID=2126346 RepID=UPI001E3E6BF3|nr:Lrp/AsnC family transcriptional regulator [Peterkaempfera bronchialis]
MDLESTGLDDVDREVVRELQADGRLQYETLAQRVGLSRPAVRARVQRLLDSGALRVVAIVHPAVQGVTASGHVSIDVRGEAEPVARAVAALPQAPFVTLAAGRRPVVAELRAADFPALTEVLDRVRALPGVEGVQAQVYTRVIKDPYLMPAAPADGSLDEVDRHLLDILQLDGRLPFADLAERVGLSPGATRARTLRLMDSGVARVVALVRPEVLGLGFLCGFAVRLEGAAAGAAERIASWPQVSYLSACVGSADLVGTVTAESLGAVRRTLEAVRACPGVRSVESWLHLELVKERYDLGRKVQHTATPGRH